MAIIEDKLKGSILNLIKKAGEPLETREIEERFGSTRIMALYRLNMLRGEGKISGKQVGSGKGTWIWWKR